MPFLLPVMICAATPQPPLPLDLPAALSRARSDNPLLRAAKARVEERSGLITATKADAFPQVTLVGDFTRMRDVSLLSGGMTDLFTRLGISPDRLTAPRNLYTTQIVAGQPLFYWGKIGSAIEVAKMGEQEAQYGFQAAELDVLHGVAKAYLGVLSTHAELEVVEARQKTAERFREDVKAKLEAQSATELDRLRAESEYLAVLPETLQAEANHKRAMEVLCGQLGLDPKTPLAVAELGKAALDQSLPASVERSDIAQLKQQEAMLRVNERIIRSDLRPKFDLSAAYGYQAGEPHHLFKSTYNNWKVGITMKFPLFDGLRSRGKVAQNSAQAEQVRQLRLDKERNQVLDRSTADREREKAIAFVEAANKAYDAGKEALRISRESFEQGLITSLDLLQAERTERQLESQRRRAQLGLWAALFDQRKAMGLPPL